MKACSDKHKVRVSTSDTNLQHCNKCSADVIMRKSPRSKHDKLQVFAASGKL